MVIKQLQKSGLYHFILRTASKDMVNEK